VGRVLRHLRVHHVNRRQHTLLADRHGFVVESWRIQSTLADRVAHLHQVGLNGGYVVELLQFDAVIDLRRLQQRVALAVYHRDVLHGQPRSLPRHHMRFFVTHRLQMHVRFLLHNHRADLIFVEHTAALKTVILVGLLLRDGALGIEI